MDSLQFCYWLQGFSELNNGTPPNDMQWKAIRDHLGLVFNKVTPSYPGLGPDWQEKIIKDINKKPPIPNYPPIYYQPNTLPLQSGPWEITCTSQPNTQTVSIC